MAFFSYSSALVALVGLVGFSLISEIVAFFWGGGGYYLFFAFTDALSSICFIKKKSLL